jgi:hypothetical protein
VVNVSYSIVVVSIGHPPCHHHPSSPELLVIAWSAPVAIIIVVQYWVITMHPLPSIPELRFLGHHEHWSAAVMASLGSILLHSSWSALVTILVGQSRQFSVSIVDQHQHISIISMYHFWPSSSSFMSIVGD